MIMKFIKYISLLSAAVLLLTGCKDEPQQRVTERTVLVYMAANNSLGSLSYDAKDINEIKEAVVAGALGKTGRLMLFHAPTDGSKTLFEVMPDGSFVTVREYDASELVVSSDFMLKVFNDAKSYAPANDYGLIMWSHSLGWTQNGISDDGPSATPKSWGEDRGRTMNISTLARVLKASPWSWIYFDCCYMGSVEVMYEFASVLPFMVASASEIPLDGMPYQKNLPLFFKSQPDLVGAARNTYDYYNNLSGMDRTATISVFDLSGMQSLADATKPIYKESEIVTPSSFTNLPLTLDRVPLFYDLGVYVRGLCETNAIDINLLESWNKSYNKVVVYHAATPMLWSQISLENFSGMSTFIPRSESDLTYRGYDTLKWYTEVANLLYNK